MSRIMNQVNPNDLLGKRIVDIAKGNRTGDAFLRGLCSHFLTQTYCITDFLLSRFDIWPVS